MSTIDWVADQHAPRWIGLDVGGANLKIANGCGRAESRPFELWRHPGALPEAIVSLVGDFAEEPYAGMALTMTGELADCYETKAAGVGSIVEATQQALQGVQVRVATVDDRWLTPEELAKEPLSAAAANWRLGARLAAKATGVAGLWIDIGSTTTDVTPFDEGRVTSRGRTDTQRLLEGELLYSGVRRTPVCALVDSLPYRGRECPVMAEWFATTADAWLLLGDLAEDPQGNETADGRPFTIAASRERLARCVGADRETFAMADAVAAAEAIAEQQRQRLTEAISKHDTRSIFASGEGAFLAREAATEAGVEDFRLISERVPRGAAAGFPAHAAAVLAGVEVATIR